MAGEKDTVKIRLPRGLTAVLGANGRWECNDKDLEQYLNLRFDPSTSYRSGMPCGWACAVDAARVLGGKPVFPYKLKPLPKGEVS